MRPHKNIAKPAISHEDDRMLLESRTVSYLKAKALKLAAPQATDRLITFNDGLLIVGKTQIG